MDLPKRLQDSNSTADRLSKVLQEAKDVVIYSDQLVSARKEVENSQEYAVENPIYAMRELDKARTLSYPDNVITMGKILALCQPFVVRWIAEDYIRQMEECVRTDYQNTNLDDSGLVTATQIGWVLLLVNPNKDQLSPQFVAWRDVFADSNYTLSMEAIHVN